MYPKVLFLTSTFLPTVGGLQYELKWFLDGLNRHLEKQNDIQAHFAYPNASSVPYASFTNITAHDLALTETKGRARIVTSLASLLIKIRPDIVHCHAVRPDGLWVLAASRLIRMPVAIIVTSHGHDIVNLPQWDYGRVHSPGGKFLTEMCTKRLAAHVLPSKAMRDWAIAAGTPNDKTVVIPNVIPSWAEYDFEVDPGYYSPLHGNACTTSAPNGKTFNILSLSSTRKIKNLDSLVKAFAMAKPSIDYAKLRLACPGSGRKRIVQLINALGLKKDVDIIGEITGPRKHLYFRTSDIYCLTSHFESFSISLLEAMKFGTAIAASRVGGVPEIVEHEHNGLLIPPTDVTKIAAALVRLYKDTELRKRLTENAATVVKQFSVSRAIADHISLYYKVVSMHLPCATGTKCST